MSYGDKYCHCDECSEKKHCDCDDCYGKDLCGCDWECPDPSPCNCGECKQLFNTFADCSPHTFLLPGSQNLYFVVTLYRKLVSREFVTRTNISISTQNLHLLANKFNVKGKFLCPFLVWARKADGAFTLVRLAPGSDQPVKIIDPPSLECKAHLVSLDSFFVPNFTNAISETNPFNSLTNSTRGTNPNPFNRNRNIRR